MNSDCAAVDGMSATAAVKRPYFVYVMRGLVSTQIQPSSQPTRRTRTARRHQSSAIVEPDAPVPTNPTTGRMYGYVHVGKSRHPIRKVIRHNNQLVRFATVRQAVHVPLSSWRLEDWFGPFWCRERARAFQRLWTTALRLKSARRPALPDQTHHYSTRRSILTPMRATAR